MEGKSQKPKKSGKSGRFRLELTSLDSEFSIIHVASNVSEDLGLEAHVADLLAVIKGLLRGGGGGQFDVFDTKVRESLSDLHLGLGIEEGIGELFSLYKYEQTKEISLS